MLQFSVSAQDTTIYFPWVQEGKLCQISPSGKVKLDSNIQSIAYPSQPSKDQFQIYEDQGMFGFKDDNQNIIIKAGYEKVGHFREGFAWVKIDHKRYYYIDKNEEPLINFTFDRCFDFQNGLARVYDKNPNLGYNGFGYINTKGKIVIDLKYKKAFDFVNGYALVQDQELKWWLIDATGKKVQGPCIGMQSRKNNFIVK